MTMKNLKPTILAEFSKAKKKNSHQKLLNSIRVLFTLQVSMGLLISSYSVFTIRPKPKRKFQHIHIRSCSRRTKELLWTFSIFCQFTQQFSKIPKMLLWVFSVINNRLAFSFLQCLFFSCKIILSYCNLLLLASFCERLLLPVVYCVVYGYTVKFGDFSSPEKKRYAFFSKHTD